MLIGKIMGYTITETSLGVEVWFKGKCEFIGSTLQSCYKWFTK